MKDYRLTPNQRCDEALRSILLQLLATLRANVDGVINDLDVEFLHDLRVAGRRTRSALAQIRGVLPQNSVDSFNTEFKWLGSVTGPCRDLDVFLLEMDSYRQRLGASSSHLEPLQRLIEQSRQEAYHQVRVGLQSRRFHRLVETWQDFLTAPSTADPSPRNADLPVAELAGNRILKAYRRTVKRGLKLGQCPPSEAMHRIRIDAKKLRYLLEFFASLYPKNEIDGLVKELKRFQDILGGFNDMQVQGARLAEFAQRLSEEGDTPAETRPALDRLAAEMGRRQEAYRHAFSSRFTGFADRSSRTRYEELFGAGTSSLEP
jgi:CHAD domain-containing protein